MQAPPNTVSPAAQASMLRERLASVAMGTADGPTPKVPRPLVTSVLDPCPFIHCLTFWTLAGVNGGLGVNIDVSDIMMFSVFSTCS